jgi:hypothetical protein
MRVEKTVTIDIEVDVSITELVSELPANASNTADMLSGLNTFLIFGKSLPDDLLATLNEKQSQIILENLQHLSHRIQATQHAKKSCVQPT